MSKHRLKLEPGCPCDCHRGGMDVPCSLPGGCGLEYHRETFVMPTASTTGAKGCNATVKGQSCGYRADDLLAHAQQTGHVLCRLCLVSLRDEERNVCAECVKRTRSDLNDILEAVALAPIVMEQFAYAGRIPIDLLAYTSDGSYSPGQRTHPELYPAIEWPKDPTSVLAVLESWERIWREDFGAAAATTTATVAGSQAYLAQWLWLAGRTLDYFDEFSGDVHRLASRLRHAVGLANDPVVGTKCPHCEGWLVRSYRRPTEMPVKTYAGMLPRIAEQRAAELTYQPNGVRALTPLPDEETQRVIVQRSSLGEDKEGLEDMWHCSSCGITYDWSNYGLALRNRAAEAAGWVPVKLACEVVRRPRSTIWAWINRGTLGVACRRLDRVVVVPIDDVRALDEVKRRREAGAKERKAAALCKLGEASIA